MSATWPPKKSYYEEFMFGDVAIRYLLSTPQPCHYSPYDQIIQQTNKLVAARVAAKEILLLGFCVRRRCDKISCIHPPTSPPHYLRPNSTTNNPISCGEGGRQGNLITRVSCPGKLPYDFFSSIPVPPVISPATQSNVV